MEQQQQPQPSFALFFLDAMFALVIKIISHQSHVCTLDDSCLVEERSLEAFGFDGEVAFGRWNICDLELNLE